MLFLLNKTKSAISSLKQAFILDPKIKSSFEKEYPEVKTSKLFINLLDL